MILTTCATGANFVNHQYLYGSITSNNFKDIVDYNILELQNLMVLKGADFNPL